MSWLLQRGVSELEHLAHAVSEARNPMQGREGGEKRKRAAGVKGIPTDFGELNAAAQLGKGQTVPGA